MSASSVITRALRPLALVGGLLAITICRALAADLVGPAQAKDGDSLILAGREIRLGGIDAPEWKQECAANGVRWRCGRAAAAVLASLTAGKTVACADTGERSYQRIVALCFVDGEDLGGRLVALGWAVDVPRFSGGRYAAREA